MKWILWQFTSFANGIITKKNLIDLEKRENNFNKKMAIPKEKDKVTSHNFKPSG